MDLLETVLTVGFRLGLAALIIWVGRKLAELGRNRLRPTLVRAGLSPSLVTLASTGSYFGIWLLAIMAALVVLGIPLDRVLLVAVAVLVVLGIALQESLRDIAATVNFILFRHFEPGDLIETNGIIGTVQEIELLNTTLLRGDSKLAVLPNGLIQQNGLLNYSKTGTLRVDMVLNISYEDDLLKTKEVIRDVLDEDERILDDPAPMIVVLDLADNGVNVGIRPHVQPKDYWQVKWDLAENIKLRFDREGIKIPFPQRTVHMASADPARLR